MLSIHNQRSSWSQVAFGECCGYVQYSSQNLASCAWSTAACPSLTPHHGLLPQNLWTGSNPQFFISPPTHFSIIVFQWMFPKSWTNSSSCTLPWPGTGCPFPPSRIAPSLPNKWTLFCLPRNSESPPTNLSPLDHCLPIPGFLPQTTCPRPFFLGFNFSATHSLFLFAAGLCYLRCIGTLIYDLNDNLLLSWLWDCR